MLSSEEQVSLANLVVNQLHIPISCGDRVDVARAAVQTTIQRLAPIVILDKKALAQETIIDHIEDSKKKNKKNKKKKSKE